MLAFFAYGCTGGLSCGGQSGCAEAYPFPDTVADVPNGTNFVDDGARLRLTQSALDFLRTHLRELLIDQFQTVPGNPNRIRIPLPHQTLSSNPLITIGQGPEETYQTYVLIDVDDFQDKLTFQFVQGIQGATEGIRIGVTNLPVGVDARVFASATIIEDIVEPNAACHVTGTACAQGDPGCGIITSVSFQALVKPSVRSNADCDTGDGECLRLAVTVENFDLGNVGAGSLAISVPPFDSDRCAAPAPTGCSPSCSDPSAPFSAEAECDILCGAADFLTNVVLTIGGFLEDNLNTQLTSLVQNAVNDALENIDGTPLSASSRLDLAGFAPGILPDSALDLGFAIAPTAGAFDVNDPSGLPGAMGMNLNIKTGFEAARPLDPDEDPTIPHPCARSFVGSDFNDLYGINSGRFEVPDAEPLTGAFDDGTGEVVYHVGASLGAAAVNQLLFGVYNTGALCIEMSSDDVEALTGGEGFSLSAGTLNLLTGGQLVQFAEGDAPVIVALVPNQPPVARLGAGTIDEGHLVLEWPSVEVSFYVLMYERFARVFSVTTDISLQLAVFNEPGTETLRLAVVQGPDVSVRADGAYGELLQGVDFRDIVSQLVGIALDLALGDGLEFNYDIGNALSEALQTPIFVDFVGLETAPAVDREFLNVYLSLTDTPPSPRMASPLRPRLAEDAGIYRLPEVEQLQAGMKVLPTGQVRIAVDDPEMDREYFARVDFGSWKGPLVARDGVVVVKDGKLSLVGHHEVLLRSRWRGLPNSLSDGESVDVWVDALPPRAQLVREGDEIVATGSDDGSPANSLQWSWQIDDGAFGDFSSQSRLQLAELSAGRVSVVARDQAGNVSRPVSLDLQVARARLKDEREQQSFLGDRASCAAGAGVPAWLALVAIGLLRRRRRS